MKHLFSVAVFALLLFIACSPSDLVELKTGDASLWQSKSDVALNDTAMILSSNNSSAQTKAEFKNFELTFECLTTEGAVGAVVFHTDGSPEKGYEVYINNNESVGGWRKTGGLTAVRNFAKRTVGNDVWFPVSLQVSGEHIKVYVNDVFVTDYIEPERPYRIVDYAGMLLSEGTIRFESRAGSPIMFRNIQVKKLADDIVTDNSLAIDEMTDEIIRLQQQNFPTIDYHLHLKGGWIAEQAAAQARRYGITYAIAPNCGKNFPITTDQQMYDWLDSMRHYPFLLPMQAEGREWIDMFSEEAMSKFDYRFTDAMTWTDHKGRRMRLWIPEETFVDNKEQFMDMLVDRAYGIITTEPIDVYVNPTYIPGPLMPEYDKLWTDKRMQKVIDACVEAGVAIEINNIYRIPSARFIKMAKDSGAKFTFGTNNTSPDDVGKLEYSIQMVKECDLKPEDMYIPVSKNY
jgi:hypothetical protein